MIIKHVNPSFLRVVLFKIVLVVVAAGMSACATNTNNDLFNELNRQGALRNTKPVVCKDPRPLICTREFDPVCAIKEDLDGNQTLVTYATGCTACADVRVVSYLQGACE